MTLHKSLENDDFFGKCRYLKLRCRRFGGIFSINHLFMLCSLNMVRVTVYLRSALNFYSHNLQESTDSSHENTFSPNSNT